MGKHRPFENAMIRCFVSPLFLLPPRYHRKSLPIKISCIQAMGKHRENKKRSITNLFLVEFVAPQLYLILFLHLFYIPIPSGIKGLIRRRNIYSLSPKLSQYKILSSRVAKEISWLYAHNRDINDQLRAFIDMKTVRTINSLLCCQDELRHLI